MRATEMKYNVFDLLLKITYNPTLPYSSCHTKQRWSSVRVVPQVYQYHVIGIAGTIFEVGSSNLVKFDSRKWHEKQL